MLILAMTAALAATPTCAGTETDPTAVGSGTEADPYLICTEDQLLAMQSLGASDLGASYQLTADLDMTGSTWSGIGSCTPYPGPTAGGFTGRFDGDDHVIEGLHGSSGARLGFFDCLNGATVRNLVLEDVDFAAGAYATGGLAGYALDSVVEDVRVSGEVSTTNNALGGLIGVADTSSLERVAFSGQLVGVFNVGGIIGISNGTSVADCAVIGGFEAAANAGGLIGNANGALEHIQVSRCYSAMHVERVGATSPPKIALAFGRTFAIDVGDVDDDGMLVDSVFALEHDGRRLVPIGESVGGGALFEVDRSELLTTSTYTAAGWDLVNVWYPPTSTSPPTLR